jgi:hypothetical protein
MFARTPAVTRPLSHHMRLVLDVYMLVGGVIAMGALALATGVLAPAVALTGIGVVAGLGAFITFLGMCGGAWVALMALGNILDEF